MTTGTQTIAGAKTFTGLFSPTAGIVGYTAGAIPTGNIGEYATATRLRSSQITVPNATATTVVSQTPASGTWEITFQGNLNLSSTSIAGYVWCITKNSTSVPASDAYGVNNNSEIIGSASATLSTNGDYYLPPLKIVVQTAGSDVYRGIVYANSTGGTVAAAGQLQSIKVG